MMPPAPYRLTTETPTVADYLRLRAAAGLSPKSEAAARLGLANTLFAVVVRCGETAVGMGRVVGDNGCFFQIVDMAVEPAHQKRGLSKRIFAALVDYLDANAPDSAYVSLIADGDARHLYAKFGFEPVMPASIGMAKQVRRAAPAPAFPFADDSRTA